MNGRGARTPVPTATCSRARDLFDPLSGNAVLNGIPVELDRPGRVDGLRLQRAGLW